MKKINHRYLITLILIIEMAILIYLAIFYVTVRGRVKPIAFNIADMSSDYINYNNGWYVDEMGGGNDTRQ